MKRLHPEHEHVSFLLGLRSDDKHLRLSTGLHTIVDSENGTLPPRSQNSAIFPPCYPSDLDMAVHDTPQLKNRTIPIDGNTVKALRLQRSWDIADLARKARCSEKTIINIERLPTKRVFACTLMAIAGALDVAWKDLLADPGTQLTPPLPPRRRITLTVTINVDYDDFDFSDELHERVDRLAKAIAAVGDIDVDQVRRANSVDINLQMTQPDLITFVHEFCAGRLDSHQITAFKDIWWRDYDIWTRLLERYALRAKEWESKHTNLPRYSFIFGMQYQRFLLSDIRKTVAASSLLSSWDKVGKLKYAVNAAASVVYTAISTQRTLKSETVTIAVTNGVLVVKRRLQFDPVPTLSR